MKISKPAFRTAGKNDGSSTITDTELELSPGNASGIGVTILQPVPTGPTQRAAIVLTPAEARQLGDRLVAYATANGAG